MITVIKEELKSLSEQRDKFEYSFLHTVRTRGILPYDSDDKVRCICQLSYQIEVLEKLLK